MTTEAFIKHRFFDKNRTLIKQVNEILAEYQAMGYKMTLRGIYYQLVRRDLLAENSDPAYKRLINVVARGRESGLIPWLGIVDRIRGIASQYHLDNLEDAITDMARTYLNNLWENQDYYLLVIIEKDAIAEVIQKICNRHDLPWIASRGYASASLLYRVAKLLHRKAEEGKIIRVLHLADLDPSGWDMTSDLLARIVRYGNLYLADFNFSINDFQWTDQSKEWVNWRGDHGLEFFRVALNEDQIAARDLPPKPAKGSDSRSPFFINKFGRAVYELDALAPPELDQIITDEVEKVIDQDQWDHDKEVQENDKKILQGLTDWNEDLLIQLAEMDVTDIQQALDQWSA